MPSPAIPKHLNHFASELLNHIDVITHRECDKDHFKRCLATQSSIRFGVAASYAMPSTPVPHPHLGQQVPGSITSFCT